MENTIETLGAVLARIDQIESDGCALYLNFDAERGENTPCAILHPEDSPDPGVIDPQIAQKNSLRYALFIDALKDIIDNARQQKKDAGLTELLDAFNYYVEFDAFIDFSRQ